MSGGTAEIHRDNEPLIEVTHQGPSASIYLIKRRYRWDAVGAKVGLYIENTTKSYYGLISAVSDTGILTVWATGPTGALLTFGDEELTLGNELISFGEYDAWDYGDTAKIYKTSSKGQILSTIWTDLSRGWKTHPDELDEGWRFDDVDLDRDDPGHVFGPGQPENYRR